MKRLKNYLLYGFIVGFIAVVSCTEDNPDPNPDNNVNDTTDVDNPNNNDDPGDDDPVNTNVDPDEVTGSIILKNGTTVAGNIPEFTMVADLKIDLDTIFWVKGIKKRIRIKKPANVAFGSFSAQVENSTSYIKGKFEKEEESDTIGVLYFEFDDTGWDPPFSFNLKLVPEDESGTPLDDFEIPVEIEEPASGNCNLNPANYWQWIYTLQDGKFVSAPAHPRITAATVKGCCIEGVSVYSGSSWICPFEEHREVNYEAVFMVESDFLLLLPEGRADGGMTQFTQNLNVGDTDFCSGSVGYNIRNTANSYNSDYTFDPSSCTITIDSFEGLYEDIVDDDGNYYGQAPLPIYAGSGQNVEYKLLSKHFMKEIRNVEGVVERMYEAEFGALGFTTHEWGD